MTEVQFYQAEFTGDTVVGGGATTTVLSDIMTDDLTSPAHGIGTCWVYDKYFLNVLDGGTVRNVSIYLSASNNPEQVLFANTLNLEDTLTGDRIVYGDQSDLVFIESGITIDGPDFNHIYGAPNALKLYNISGELGGQVDGVAGTGNALAFWTARRLDEHIISGETFFSIEVTYDS